MEGYSKQVDAEAGHFVTAKSSKEVRRQHHLGEHALPWLEHVRWGWVKSRYIPDGKPSEVQYDDELDGHLNPPRVSYPNRKILISMEKDPRLWRDFTNRFLT